MQRDRVVKIAREEQRAMDESVRLRTSTRVVGAQLFGLSSSDPLMFAAAILAISTVWPRIFPRGVRPEWIPWSLCATSDGVCISHQIRAIKSRARCSWAAVQQICTRLFAVLPTVSDTISWLLTSPHVWLEIRARSTAVAFSSAAGAVPGSSIA